jgi:predicted DCC family thiol-disulfide oxidoreductase YuxK
MVLMSTVLSPRQAELEVFYDADCGFCTRSARVLRRLDRARRIQLTPLRRAADRVADAPPVEHLLDLMHARSPSGEWWVGGAAWLRIADLVTPLRPLGWFARLPVVRRFVEPVYRLVAANRRQLSRLLGEDACRTDRIT